MARKINEVLTQADYLKLTRAGGRCLDAIWDNPSITLNEAVTLTALSRKCDFTGAFLEFRYIAIEALAVAAKLSVSAVRRAIKSLIQKGFLEKKERFEKGQQKSNLFGIHEKLFAEFFRIVKETGVPQGQGGGCPIDTPRGFTETSLGVSERDPDLPSMNILNDNPFNATPPGMAEKTEKGGKVTEIESLVRTIFSANRKPGSEKYDPFVSRDEIKNAAKVIASELNTDAQSQLQMVVDFCIANEQTRIRDTASLIRILRMNSSDLQNRPTRNETTPVQPNTPLPAPEPLPEPKNDVQAPPVQQPMSGKSHRELIESLPVDDSEKVKLMRCVEDKGMEIESVKKLAVSFRKCQATARLSLNMWLRHFGVMTV